MNLLLCLAILAAVVVIWCTVPALWVLCLPGVPMAHRRAAALSFGHASLRGLAMLPADLLAHLQQRLVKLRLDPSQHRVAHRVAQGAHRRLPARRGRPALPGAGGRLLLTILIDSFPRRTLRPAT